MVTDRLRELWTEPAPPEISVESRLDNFLIPSLVLLGLADGLLSDDVGWAIITVPVMMLLPLVLHWRHRHLLWVTGTVFGVYTILHAAMLIAGVSSTFLNAGVIVVCLYTLARWASGRQAIIGLGFAAVGTGFAGSTAMLRTWEGAIGLPGFVSICLLAGVAVRFGSARDAAQMSEAKMYERNRIARELHDTVAHHVSAIAVQAQGAQEILTKDPAAAGEALRIISEQASITLTEMRLILGVLRDENDDSLAPAPGFTELTRLATNGGAGPIVEVSLAGKLDHLSHSVETAVFRIAQEAVTNARRHARNPTKVKVEVFGSDDDISLTVCDDGAPTGQSGSGYGLLGMSERASLLGGEFHAGPSPSDGWVVRATFPHTGRTS